MTVYTETESQEQDVSTSLLGKTRVETESNV